MWHGDEKEVRPVNLVLSSGSLPGFVIIWLVVDLLVGIEFVSGAIEEIVPIDTQFGLRYPCLIADIFVYSDRGILG